MSHLRAAGQWIARVSPRAFDDRLGGSLIIDSDPVTREERLRLARDYNQDRVRGQSTASGINLSFAIAPLPIDGGGMLLIGGRF